MSRAPWSITLALVASLTLLLSGCSDDSPGSKPDGTGGGADGTVRADGANTDGAGGGDSGSGDTGGGDAVGGDAGGGDTGGGDGGGTHDSGGNRAMSFFVTSVGLGKGGNLGGLAGADAHCKKLARAAKATRTQWVAYLSASRGNVDASSRIGKGPWYNANGEVFAKNLTALHPSIDPEKDRAGYIRAKPADKLFFDETGKQVPGRQHDILTGSTGRGTASANKTCKDWTSSADSDIARVGHSDTPGSTNFSPSWNSAHDTTGCSQSGVSARGGSGRFYCFATD